MAKLFDEPRRPRRPRWTGGLDVVPWPQAHICPDCRGLLNVSSGADTLALFWMHGYGAIVRTTHVTCPCGYRRHWKTETITPRG